MGKSTRFYISVILPHTKTAYVPAMLLHLTSHTPARTNATFCKSQVFCLVLFR